MMKAVPAFDQGLMSRLSQNLPLLQPLIHNITDKNEQQFVFSKPSRLN